MSKYFIHEGNVREYTKTGHKWLSPLAIVRKLNKLEKENAELRKEVTELETTIMAMSLKDAHENLNK